MSMKFPNQPSPRIPFDSVILVGCIAVVVLCFVKVLDYTVGLPDVVSSISKGRCVEVVNHRNDDNYTCDNLPPKYHHIKVR